MSAAAGLAPKHEGKAAEDSLMHTLLCSSEPTTCFAFSIFDFSSCLSLPFLFHPASVVCPEDNLPGQHGQHVPKVAALVFCR